MCIFRQWQHHTPKQPNPTCSQLWISTWATFSRLRYRVLTFVCCRGGESTKPHAYMSLHTYVDTHIAPFLKIIASLFWHFFCLSQLYSIFGLIFCFLKNKNMTWAIILKGWRYTCQCILLKDNITKSSEFYLEVFLHWHLSCSWFLVSGEWVYIL